MFSQKWAEEAHSAGFGVNDRAGLESAPCHLLQQRPWLSSSALPKAQLYILLRE